MMIMRLLHTALALTAVLSSAAICQAAEVASPACKAVQALVPIQPGLCADLCCGEGQLLCELAGATPWVIHAVEPDPARAEQASKHVVARGHWGRVTVDASAPAQLPFADGIVNVVIIEDWPRAAAAGLTGKEIQRALTPDGVALVRWPDPAAKLGLADEKWGEMKAADGWVRLRKARDPALGEWPQWLHGPDLNFRNDDTVVAPGRHLRFRNRPWFDNAAPETMNNVYVGGGRFYYFQNDWIPGETRNYLRAMRWYLIARDAYNGALLWRVSVGRPFQRMFAADGDRVFAAIDGTLSCLDATNGKVVRTYDASRYLADRGRAAGGLLLLYSDGILLLRQSPAKPCSNYNAIRAEDDKLLWSLPGQNAVISEGRTFLDTPEAVVCVNLRSGAELWKVPQDRLPRSLGKEEKGEEKGSGEEKGGRKGRKKRGQERMALPFVSAY